MRGEKGSNGSGWLVRFNLVWFELHAKEKVGTNKYLRCACLTRTSDRTVDTAPHRDLQQAPTVNYSVLVGVTNELAHAQGRSHAVSFHVHTCLPPAGSIRCVFDLPIGR
jgi:hypothetical protein